VAVDEISHLHTDNGIFTANVFCDDCKPKQQSQSFSGIGATHQNITAEQTI
jgi:hypothetical protein